MPHPSPRLSFAFADRDSARSSPAVHEQVARLIGRYPALTQPELERLAGMFPRLTALDMSMMMADTDLSAKLEAFCTTHRALLRPSAADLAVIGAILSLPILILATIILTGA